MRARWMKLGAVALIGAGAAAAAWTWPAGTEATAPPTLDALATDAVEAEDEATRERAIAALRSRGREGHEALMRVHAGAIEALRAGAFEGDPERLRHAVDVVSGQRDGHASGLYWHTDLAAAQRVARSTGRPILSLRLLGELDEELSCANSRFFRVVLYSDPAVAALLEEQFVLHWSSERPAPRIEIDMGDGRRIVRTITGNSAHYVLDADGRPIDVLVGLYAPDHFRAVLEAARARHDGCASEGPECLAGRHRLALGARRAAWNRLRQRDYALPRYDEMLASLPTGEAGPAPSATAAMPLTMGKSSREMPMLDLLVVEPTAAAAREEPDWQRVAGRRGFGRAALSENTRALLRLKTGRDDVEAMAAELARTAAADGVRNEELFHRRVHDWFVSRPAVVSGFETLNARVYAELMLTPASDPWLGLRADDLYDGIEVEVSGAGTGR